MRRILFHRRFTGYAGGHGKVRDYGRHAQAHPGFLAETWLTPDSISAQNPWLDSDMRLADQWLPEAADILFLAGFDWEAVPDDRVGRPVINLLQGLGHADHGDPRRGFLRRPAVRVCVSHAVADAVLATGEVNGPVHVIPAAQDLAVLSCLRPESAQAPRIAIAGGKAPALAEAVAAALQGVDYPVDLLPGGLPRSEFLGRIGAADIAVLLPLEREGFYLPGLEAMAMGTAVVLPDAVGNREYVRPGLNALSPAREAGAIADAALWLRDPERRRVLATAGLATAAQYTLARERTAFHALLDRLDAEWARCRHDS